MELRHLRYFAAVAEEENISRAARRLNVSQPPLSRQIRDLESHLGVTLLERGGSSVRLTPAGRVFYDEARAVLARAESATQTLRAFAGKEHGVLQVGFAPSLSVEFLPRALRGFDARWPGTQVVLHDLSTGEMLDGLLDGTLDVAFIIRPRRPKGIEFRELARYRVCVCAAPGHPVSRLPAPGLKKILGERLIGYRRKDYPEYFDWLEKLAGKSWLPAEEHDSATSLIASVESGRGIALVPETFSCFAGQRLVVKKLHPPPPPFVVGVAFSKSNKSPLVNRWLEVLA